MTMSRYIDYDAIDYKHYQLHDKSEEFLNGVIYMAQRIEEAPSIDIVRCKECKHWHREINESGVEYVNFSKCTKGHYGNGLDFHCADGEREGE